MAAVSACEWGDLAVPVEEVLDQGQSSLSADHRLFEAIQSLSSQFNAQFTELMDRVSTLEQSNGAGTPSLPDPGNLDFRIPVAREIFGNGEGSSSDDGEEELVQDASPTHEKEIVDSRSLHNLEPVPKSAADFRAWKNSLILLLGRLDVSGADFLTSWISASFGVMSESECEESSGLVPRLDPWLASELVHGLKQIPFLA